MPIVDDERNHLRYEEYLHTLNEKTKKGEKISLSEFVAFADIALNELEVWYRKINNYYNANQNSNLIYDLYTKIKACKEDLESDLECYKNPEYEHYYKNTDYAYYVADIDKCIQFYTSEINQLPAKGYSNRAR